jgi:hypothetical protein
MALLICLQVLNRHRHKEQNRRVILLTSLYFQTETRRKKILPSLGCDEVLNLCKVGQLLVFCNIPFTWQFIVEI